MGKHFSILPIHNLINKLMRIFAFSDWRTQPISPLYEVLANLEPSPDIILYAGDDASRFIDISYHHFHGLAQTADAELGFVLGNDDLPQTLQKLKLETSRVTDLHQTPLSVNGYTILGQSGDVGVPAMGYIRYSEKQAASHLENAYTDVEGDRLIVVSHTPPFGALDYAQRYSHQRVGSQAVRDFVVETNPTFVLCGHVHQFGGQTAYQDYGPVVNVASHDSDRSSGNIVLIDVPDADSTEDIEISHTTLLQLIQQTSSGNTELSGPSSLQTLTQIGSSRSEELHKAGIEGIEDIASQSKDKFKRQTMIPESCLERAHSHAVSFYCDEIQITDGSEYERLQGEGTVLIDIETDLEQSRVWCIGAYSYHDDEFTQLVSLDDEHSLIEEFYEYLRQQDSPRVVYYAGNSFDENRLSEAADRAKIQLLDALDDWIDLCLIARRTLFYPNESHELETAASELGYIFAHPDVTGLEVGSAYSTYLSEGEIPNEGWEKYLRYNLDDVLGIKHILDVAVEYEQSKSQDDTSIGRTDTPKDRSQYQIGSVSIQPQAETETNRGGSTAKSEVTCSSQMENTNNLEGSPDPYEIIKGGESVAEWSETKPVPDDVSPTPRCSACGRKLVTDDERKEFSIDNETKLICRGGCPSDTDNVGRNGSKKRSDFESGLGDTDNSSTDVNSRSQRVVCHECEDTVLKRVATGKYRINDDKTLWYCPSCE